jgi:penicillin-binding protein-related factor A (putative recombinase)
LNSLPECYAVKTRGDYRQGGQPDIIGCYKGRALALEVKRPGGKATALQLAILAKWQQAGAVTGVIRSVEEVKKIMEKRT